MRPHQIFRCVCSPTGCSRVSQGSDDTDEAAEQRLIASAADLLYFPTGRSSFTCAITGVVSIRTAAGCSRSTSGLRGTKRIFGKLDLTGPVQHQQHAAADHITQRSVGTVSSPMPAHTLTWTAFFGSAVNVPQMNWRGRKECLPGVIDSATVAKYGTGICDSLPESDSGTQADF